MGRKPMIDCCSAPRQPRLVEVPNAVDEVKCDHHDEQREVPAEAAREDSSRLGRQTDPDQCPPDQRPLVACFSHQGVFRAMGEKLAGEEDRKHRRLMIEIPAIEVHPQFEAARDMSEAAKY